MTSPALIAVVVGNQPRAKRDSSSSSAEGRWSQTATAVTTPNQVES